MSLPRLRRPHKLRHLSNLSDPRNMDKLAQAILGEDTSETSDIQESEHTLNYALNSEQGDRNLSRKVKALATLLGEDTFKYFEVLCATPSEQLYSQEEMLFYYTVADAIYDLVGTFTANDIFHYIQRKSIQNT